MPLQLTDQQLIAELQDKFTECFPDLAIEFYYPPLKKGKAAALAQRIPPTYPIGQIRRNHRIGTLKIKSWFRTLKVEEGFRGFGLNVQILRRQGADWVPKKDSGELTLKEQSELAKRFGEKHSIDEVPTEGDEAVLPAF